MDKKSKLGYSKGSPYKRNPYLDINTPEGYITMANTEMDLIGVTPQGEVQYMKAGNRNPYRFNSSVVREFPVYQRGGITQDMVDFLFEEDDVPQAEAPTTEAPVEVDIEPSLEEQRRALIQQEEYNLAMSLVLGPQEERVSRRNSRSTGYTSQPMNVNVAPVDSNKNAKFAFDYYQQQGIQPHIAAGIVGNLMQESGLNPTIKGDNGKATGIAQWHPDRFSGLVKWARSQNRDPYSLDAQLDYVLVEAKSRGDLDALQSSKNSGEAAYIFAKKFERPKVIDNKRIGYAKSLHPY